MISRKVVLHFPQHLIDKPIISNMVKKFDLEFNILKAFITPNEEGLLVLELIGKRQELEEALGYLRELDVKIQALSRDVVRDENLCVHCGACTVICPTGALYMDGETHEVIFSSEKCIACELCVKECPYKAMKVSFK